MSSAAAANLGASKARGRWLLFLDPHVVLQRGAVARMAAAGGGARTPWIVGGRLTDTEGASVAPRAAGRSTPGPRSRWRWIGPGRSRRSAARKTRPQGAAGTDARCGGLGRLHADPAQRFPCARRLRRRLRHRRAPILIFAAAPRTRAAACCFSQTPRASNSRAARGRPRKRKAWRCSRLKSAKTPIQRAFAMIARPRSRAAGAARSYRRAAAASRAEAPRRHFSRPTHQQRDSSPLPS